MRTTHIIFQIAKREVFRIATRPLYLFCMVIAPLFCYIFFTTLMWNGLPTDMPAGVVDLDNTATTRNIIRNLDAFQQTKIVAHYAGFADARKAMQEGKIYAFYFIPEGTTAKALSKGYLRLFSAVLQGAFHFAVFPKRLITFNPMQYVVWRGKKEDYDLFSDEDGNTDSTPTLSHEQYLKLEEFLKKKDNPALLPIQIAYYTGLRIGEACGLTW